MAITRINNNQITDSVAGNIYLGVNAAVKIQDFTITAGKIQNNLTYNSDLTVTGNLTVQGNTTAIDTVNLVVEDPLILLAKEQTGSPALDIGFIGKRGTEDNIAFVWDESADQFVAVFTTSEVTNSVININSYASLQVLDLAAANLDITGNIDFSGNIVGNVTVTGNVDANNFNATAAVTAGTTVTATGNVIGGNLTTAGLVAATGNVIGGNLTTAGVVAATGNVSGGNITTAGNVDGANINAVTNVTATTVTASGNVNATTAVNANLIAGTSVQIDSTGDIVLNPTGNINASGVRIRNMSDPELAFDAATKQYVDDAVSAGIHIHQPVDVETTAPLTTVTYAQGGNVFTVNETIAGNTVVFTTAANLQVNDQLWFDNSFNGVVGNLAYFVVSTPNTSAAVLSTAYNGVPVSNITSGSSLTESVRVNSGVGATLTATANGAIVVDGVSLVAGNRVMVNDQLNQIENGVYDVTDAGNVSAPYILTRSSDADLYIPDSSVGLDQGSYFYVERGDVGAGTSYVKTAPAGPYIIGLGNIEFTQFSSSQVYSANTQAGLVLNGTVFSAKVDNETTAFDGGGNISVKVSANLTTPNIGDATGNSLTLGGNGLLSATTVSATGNIGGANIDASAGITAGTTIVANGNISGANIDASAGITAGTTIVATGNVTGGNVVTTGTADLGNIRITGNDITNFASNIITINSAASDIDVRISGDTVANLLLTDAGTDTVVIGGGNATTGAALKIDTTDSMMVPVGNTLQRPGTPELGMFRFNTGGDALEVYTSGGWEDVGVPAFTVIIADAFVGDGSTLAFTLSANSTTAGTIVAINGVVQEPTTAYSVSLTTLTFTEAPAVSDNIDARILTTTTTVTNIENVSGNAVVEVLDTADTVQITGNLLPLTSNIFNIGSSSLRWNELFLQGSTITLGNVVIKNTSGNTIGFFGPDGTTPGAIDTNNIDSAGISNGTSSVQVIASGGNVRTNVAGATVQTISSTGVAITGDLSVTGNATLSGNILGDRIQNGTTQIDIQTQDGNANITVGGVSNVAVFSSTGAAITGTLSSSGNANVGNLGTAGLIVATGNISGGNLITAGLVSLASITKTGSNGVGNIGSSTSVFDTVFAKATSALYADLAEMYEADAVYEPGTVLCFGGAKEVTRCGQADSTRVAGVVSTNPSYLMNSGQAGDNVVAVALTGRVPCRVTGTVRKGDLMVSTGDGRACANNAAAVGTVIGKALADFDGADGVIEVVVGRV
jgi:hypothetical protein